MQIGFLQHLLYFSLRGLQISRTGESFIWISRTVRTREIDTLEGFLLASLAGNGGCVTKRTSFVDADGCQ